MNGWRQIEELGRKNRTSAPPLPDSLSAVLLEHFVALHLQLPELVARKDGLTVRGIVRVAPRRPVAIGRAHASQSLRTRGKHDAQASPSCEAPSD